MVHVICIIRAAPDRECGSGTDHEDSTIRTSTVCMCLERPVRLYILRSDGIHQTIFAEFMYTCVMNEARVDQVSYDPRVMQIFTDGMIISEPLLLKVLMVLESSFRRSHCIQMRVKKSLLQA